MNSLNSLFGCPWHALPPQQPGGNIISPHHQASPSGTVGAALVKAEVFERRAATMIVVSLSFDDQ
jgi:hypothetical protein